MDYQSFRWSGGEEMLLGQPVVTACGAVVVGRFGGDIGSGASKNEDAALVWGAEDGSWVFAALMDAHGSCESSDLVLGRLAQSEAEIVALLDDDRVVHPFRALSELLFKVLSEEEFRRECAGVRGETALLMCAQKGAYLWWFSVGDIPVYVFHPEFARLGQFAVNQRQFFEWVGQANALALRVPSYSTGVRQLRGGEQTILMTTDGLLECGDRRFEDSRALYELFAPGAGLGGDLSGVVGEALVYVERERGRDSATLIAWAVDNGAGDALLPSA